jgi:hypothetical protein
VQRLLNNQFRNPVLRFGHACPYSVVTGVKNDDVETRERLDRSVERMVGAEGGI